MILAYLRN
jgi:hypothetical protein